ncbi:MAG: prepilin-type N-terminal cleavage/methylation domain-containing protein [Candidatus Saccharimonadales bacterium]
MTGKHKQRGFSLIEAAIVLAVVGLVIGGIWVATSSFMQALKVNKTIEGMILIAKKTQDIIDLRSASTIGATFIHEVIIKADGVPKDWVKTSGNLISPFGKTVIIYNKVTWFEIWLKDISRTPCVNILIKFSSMSSSTGGYVEVWPSGLYTHSFPISPNNAGSFCSSTTSNEIRFAFPYIRRN